MKKTPKYFFWIENAPPPWKNSKNIHPNICGREGVPYYRNICNILKLCYRGCWKKWLPSSGPYNLEEYLYAYLWFHQKKIVGEDPFWSLVRLVSHNNSADILIEALKVKPDMIGVNDDEANLAMIEGDVEDLFDDSQTEFICPLCETQLMTESEF